MPDRPNILLITADDMNWDAVGAFGGGVYFDFFGLPLNFYLSQKTDFNSLIDGLKFDFYIGPTF